MALNTLPASVASGAIYGSPTVFNSTSTYTIPSTASVNSTIIVETFGGGGGGNTGYSQIYMISGYSSYIASNNFSNSPGNPGNYFAGVYRLGWLSTSPAGGTITVTVGAGGTGATQNATVTFATGSPVNQQTISNWVNATAGGASSVTFAGQTFGIANGGAAGSGGGFSTQTFSAMQLDTNLYSNFAPKAGGGGGYAFGSYTNTTLTRNGTNTANGGRGEYGGTLTGGGLGSNTVAFGTGTLTNTAGADATPDSGGAGGDGSFILMNGSPCNITPGRGGNGAAPGGGGGGACGMAANTSIASLTVNGGQKGGNGGAGRVRIWFQP